jgi:hypothetical protein
MLAEFTGQEGEPGADFGTVFIKFSTYFPFTPKLCVDGNEWASARPPRP